MRNKSFVREWEKNNNGDNAKSYPPVTLEALFVSLIHGIALFGTRTEKDNVDRDPTSGASKAFILKAGKVLQIAVAKIIEEHRLSGDPIFVMMS